MEEINEKSNAVSLITSTSFQNGTLSVEYKIKNELNVPVYVFNKLWEFGPEGNYLQARQPFYISLQDSGRLHLVKGIPPLPKSKLVELRIIPFATKVDAGGEMAEKLELSEPIKEYNPYFLKEKSDSIESKSNELVLIVHYIVETEGIEVKPAPLEGSLFVRHPEMFAKMQAVSSSPKPIAAKVERRTDTFDRF